jgi:hypothetical protein
MGLTRNRLFFLASNRVWRSERAAAQDLQSKVESYKRSEFQAEFVNASRSAYTDTRMGLHFGSHCSSAFAYITETPERARISSGSIASELRSLTQPGPPWLPVRAEQCDVLRVKPFAKCFGVCEAGCHPPLEESIFNL